MMMMMFMMMMTVPVSVISKTAVSSCAVSAHCVASPAVQLSIILPSRVAAVYLPDAVSASPTHPDGAAFS